MTKLYGSLEAGGTKFVCAVGDENFNVVEKTQFPTTTPIETIDKTIEFFSKFDNLAGLVIDRLPAMRESAVFQAGKAEIIAQPDTPAGIRDH